MKKIVRKIFLITNYFFAILLVISSISVYISPEKAWIFAFLGLAFPYILIVNIAFLIFWISLKRKYFIISLIVILLSWNNLTKFIQFNNHRKISAGERNIVKLLSFNVRLFNYYNWLKLKTAHQDILSFIKNEHAGIICLQEFFTLNNTLFSEDSIRNLLGTTPFSYIQYTNSPDDKKGSGIATFSHFPIVNRGKVEFGNSPNISIYSDIKIEDDTIRVYNCHLQSTRLEKDKYNFLDSLLFNYNTKHLDDIKNISHRLKDAYIKRARQVTILSNHIKTSPYPVLLCGDFNDTPVSFAYHKLRDSMKDAFLESGRGIGNTYFGNFPSFRIDYIMHNKSIVSYNFRTQRVKLSDHYPIVCKFYLKD